LENDVIEKPLSADEALDRLREVGRIEAASIAALGRMWGWKRERTSKALIRWEGAGHIQRDEGPDGTVIIRVPSAVPADDPAVPAGTAPDDGPLPASDDVPAPGPDDVPAGSPDLPASDAVPPLMEEPAGITGIPAPDDDVPAGIPAGNAPMVEKPVGVPAPLEPPQWRSVERPVRHLTVPVLCQWVFGGMSVALSFVLYAISTFLNMTFWASLNPDMTAKMILATAGFTVEFSNYVIPTVACVCAVV